MGLTAMQVPRRVRESKYTFTDEEVKQARKMLDEGKNPGQNGYESRSQARTAGQKLAGMVGDDIGVSAWEAEGEKPGSKTWAFALKKGKGHAPGSAAKPTQKR